MKQAAGHVLRARPLLALSGAAISLTLLIACCYDSGFFSANLRLAVQYLLSPPFAYWACIGIILLQKRVPDRWYDRIFFLAALMYFVLFYGHDVHVYRLHGDNVCQIAYWKVLFHPNLAGSIGASFTKPGQVVLLGVLYDLQSFLGPGVFLAGQSLIMALCIWSLSRIATDIGGRLAGVIAFPVAVGTFHFDFLAGFSSLYMVPLIFIGLRLYFYHPHRKGLGGLLLALSLQFHIQTIAVLGVVWLILLIRKDWKELAVFSGYCAASLLIWFLVILRIQGSLVRFDGGAGVGYISPAHGYSGASELAQKIESMLSVVGNGLEESYLMRFLLILAVIGIAGSFRYRFKSYLIALSAMLIFLANVLLLSGGLNISHYFGVVYAFACSVGIGAAVRIGRDVYALRSAAVAVPGIISAALLILLFNFSTFVAYKEYEFSELHSAFAPGVFVLLDQNLPSRTRLMTEDDLLYPIVVLEPGRYSALAALQHFNVSPEQDRKKILARTDFIWLSLDGASPYYYLRYRIVKDWDHDPFRMMVNDMLTTGQAGSLYGYRFEPVAMDLARMIVQVSPESGSEPQGSRL